MEYEVSTQGIRISTDFTIQADGRVFVNHSVSTPERQPQIDTLSVEPGIQVINHNAERRNRGGWPKGKPRSKKSKRSAKR